MVNTEYETLKKPNFRTSSKSLALPIRLISINIFVLDRAECEHRQKRSYRRRSADSGIHRDVGLDDRQGRVTSFFLGIGVIFTKHLSKIWSLALKCRRQYFDHVRRRGI